MNPKHNQRFSLRTAKYPHRSRRNARGSAMMVRTFSALSTEGTRRTSWRQKETKKKKSVTQPFDQIRPPCDVWSSGELGAHQI